jgi:hypothetical protein
MRSLSRHRSSRSHRWLLVVSEHGERPEDCGSCRATDEVMTRYSSLGRKIETPFGSVFVAVPVDDQGRPCGFHIAPPQKLENSSVGALIDALSSAADALMAEAIEAARER